MEVSDTFMIALTVWRENRGGGYEGMQSVANVIMNRAMKRKSSPYLECIRPLQFSSITAKSDPQTTVFPQESDPSWQMALDIATIATSGALADITGGATNYYALTMTTPPKWATEMTQTAVIERQAFFK